MVCSWSEEFQVVVHRFERAIRTCVCGAESIPEVESRTAWGRRKPDTPEGDTPESADKIKRSPVQEPNKGI